MSALYTYILRLAVNSRLESPQTNGGVSITTKYSFDSFIGSSGLFTFIHINRPAIQKFTTYGHYFAFLFAIYHLRAIHVQMGTFMIKSEFLAT